MSTAIQPALFPDYANERLYGIVNVASVPQRSPFRYPGGKTWLVPLFRRWMASLSPTPALLLEPFVGGGIIGLTTAFERLALRVRMVELDEDIAAVWQTILSSDAAWLAERIRGFSVQPETVQTVLSTPPAGPRARAFATILKNRVNHGGIMAPGSGVLKFGENGKGLRSRWYPETLARRILDINTIASRIDFRHQDGLDALKEIADQSDTVSFIDPPYTASNKRAGSRLYTHNALDHEALFNIAQTLRGDFLMTYDNDPAVTALAREHGFDTHLVPMKNTHHAEMCELLIGRNLDWVR